MLSECQTAVLGARSQNPCSDDLEHAEHIITYTEEKRQISMHRAPWHEAYAILIS